jgi:hypothetical protein
VGSALPLRSCGPVCSSASARKTLRLASVGSDEYLAEGFNRWVHTGMADYVSVQEIYWKVSGGDIDVADLPERAFDSYDQWSAIRECW